MRCALAWPALLAPTAAAAQDVEGFAELRAHAYAGVEGAPLEFIERLRPEFTAELNQRLVLTSSVELALHQGRSTQQALQDILDESDFGPILETMGCSWPEEENPFLGISDDGDYLSVQRLYLDAYLPKADLRLGRQAINWGSAFMVNPTDPFPEVLLMEPWRPRAGVNALRSTLPLGQAHQLQLVAGSDDVFQALRAAGRASFGLGVTDLSLIGAWRQEADSAIIGLDLRGTLGVGFWLEGSLHLDTRAERDQRLDPYEEIAVGIDYSFPLLESLILTGQYYRNGHGSAEYDPQAFSGDFTDAVQAPDCGDANDLFASDASADPFAPFFSGRDYAMLSLSLGVIPELSLTGLWVQNLGDGSSLAMPVVTSFPTGWLEISAAAQLPFSLWDEGGELHPADDDLVLSAALAEGMDPLQADLSGLLPSASFILWTRFNF